ncbi:MAG: hypothetical protein K2X69_08920 [Silvanigrellaceae bacterium]|nr:hypothetical protein [Silvanigrellaceae bacterium]
MFINKFYKYFSFLLLFILTSCGIQKKNESNSHDVEVVVSPSLGVTAATPQKSEVLYLPTASQKDVIDLKQKNILPSKKHATFSHWRDEMIKNRVLICMATREELQEKNPTHKGSMFKIGDRLKKYIDQAIYENLPKNVEDLNNKVDILSESLGVMDNKLDVNVSDLNNKVTSVDNKVERLESEVNTLKKKVESMAAMILKALPPDTPLRRDIVEENIHDQEKCFQKLEDETKQRSNYN